MKRLSIFSLFVALVASTPISDMSNQTKMTQTNETKKDNIQIVDDKFFPKEFKIHTTEYEITNLIFPLNGLNFDSNSLKDDFDHKMKIIFYVESDGNDNKGLSVLKSGIATKILPTGTCFATDIDNMKTAFFGATDGLYQYNAAKNTAEKYGPITDSIIDMAKVNNTDLLYIITDKHELYKVTESGTKKEKIEGVDANQIVLDYLNNLYYYGKNKKLYVATERGVKEITGLPSDPSSIKLIRPAYVIQNGAPVVLDDKVYTIYANGTSRFTNIVFKSKPSAFAIEASFIQYFALGKSIYEYNMVSQHKSDAVKELRKAFNRREKELQRFADRYHQKNSTMLERELNSNPVSKQTS